MKTFIAYEVSEDRKVFAEEKTQVRDTIIEGQSREFETYSK